MHLLMLDRQKVEAILIRRFPGAPQDQVAAAANAIMGLDCERVAVVGDVGPPAPERDRGSALRLFHRGED